LLWIFGLKNIFWLPKAFSAFLFIESLMAYGLSHFYKLMTGDPGFILPDENDFAVCIKKLNLQSTMQE
jgi:hypothetical protein